ncbi:MAG: DUF448 domain-containing protein [Desulfomicrobium sp.]|jgi:predicted RNA-binding protein YlxR (DUF448 family)|nr:DUF448 domain-containing protein [Desulfomicrobium sp.]
MILEATPSPVSHIPIRMCVICKQRFEQKALQRYTCPVHGELKLRMDNTSKNPGRGFYVCHNLACQKKFEHFKGWQKKCKGGGHVH